MLQHYEVNWRGFLFSFYDQQMFDNFCSNSDCIILFFLGASVCLEYKEEMMNTNLYWEVKNSKFF